MPLVRRVTEPSESPVPSRPSRRRRLVGLALFGGALALLIPSLVVAALPSDAATIESGTAYVLVSQGSGKALDVAGHAVADGAALQQWTRSGGGNQQWRFTAVGAGHYTVTSVSAGKVLDVAGWSRADGAPVTLWAAKPGAANQQWKVVDGPDGTVELLNRHSGKALDVAGRSTADGAAVRQWSGNRGANQRWTLVPVAGAPRPPVATSATPATGPYRWRNAEVVGGGFVSGIVFNPAERGLVYARTDMGGAYRWDRSSERWTPLTDWVDADNWNLLGIESLATDPVDPNRLYLAAGTYTNDWAGNGAILRSTDRGATFQRTNLPFKLGGNEEGRSMGERLSIDPNRPGTLYLGTRKNGLWRSTDFGVTWGRVPGFAVTGGASSGVGISFVTFDPSSGRSGGGSATIYVGVADSGTSLYRSVDAGATWQPVGAQPRGQLPHHGVLAGDGTLYLSYGNGPGPNGVTAGAVWKLNTTSGRWTDISPPTGGYGFAGLSVDASRPGTVMVSTMDRWWPHDEIYRSTDAGGSWTAISTRGTFDASAAPYVGNSIGHWIGDLEIDPFDPGHVLYVTGSGIWGSDNVTSADTGGATRWTVRAQGLEETAVIDLIAPPGGASVISALGDVAGFRHDDLTRVPAGNLGRPNFRNTTGIDFAQHVPGLIVRVGTGGGPYGGYSTDGGSSWSGFAGAPPGAQAGTVAVAADGATIVWTPKDTVPHYSRDRGASWTASRGLPAGTEVTADRAAAGTFYALSGGRLYASTDAGATFAARAGGLRQGNLEAVPGRAGDLWIGAGDAGLFHSTNGGVSFSKVGGVAVGNCVGFGRAAPGQAYPALYLTGRVNDVQGVFRSDNGGAGWVRINDDQHQWGALNSAVTGDPDVYGRVYVGTNGRGVQYGEPS